VELGRAMMKKIEKVLLASIWLISINLLIKSFYLLLFFNERERIYHNIEITLLLNYLATRHKRLSQFYENIGTRKMKYRHKMVS
jgi:hypothetical protein